MKRGVIFSMSRTGSVLPTGGSRIGLARRLWRFFRRMDDRGNVAIEMGFVAPPLFLLLLMIIDFGIMLTTQALLDGAARDAARLIRTGQITGSSGITAFQTQLCADMSPILSNATCLSQVLFSVQVFSNFGTIGTVGFNPCTQNFNATGSGTACAFASSSANQIVGVRVVYNRPFIVPWVGACLTGGSCWFGVGTQAGSATGTNTVPLIATVIFQNEPFPS